MQTLDVITQESDQFLQTIMKQIVELRRQKNKYLKLYEKRLRQEDEFRIQLNQCVSDEQVQLVYQQHLSKVKQIIYPDYQQCIDEHNKSIQQTQSIKEREPVINQLKSTLQQQIQQQLNDSKFEQLEQHKQTRNEELNAKVQLELLKMRQQQLKDQRFELLLNRLTDLQQLVQTNKQIVLSGIEQERISTLPFHLFADLQIESSEFEEKKKQMGIVLNSIKEQIKQVQNEQVELENPFKLEFWMLQEIIVVLEVLIEKSTTIEELDQIWNIFEQQMNNYDVKTCSAEKDIQLLTKYVHQFVTKSKENHSKYILIYDQLAVKMHPKANNALQIIKLEEQFQKAALQETNIMQLIELHTQFEKAKKSIQVPPVE
ncbi:Hypothetical_protein [Hexamita inflata]|uniref:Hypothetical_protein n=1 Tax=Hexamita inflata TaxID=28002 RepID=A0AA86PD91_9EUKA|nr:Hypothetical protein HINF_LOCUS24574 [Hexamita inflata]